MIKKRYTGVDVLTMARKRIKNIFSNGIPVALSVSGGKDSICMNDLVFRMCQSGEIDKSLLTVDFVDEEAIYPCVEEIVKGMRRQWLSIGVPFRWWAMEFRHFNCFNQLTEGESFICWDRFKRDVWVRERPQYSITSHSMFKARKDTYQQFLPRINKDKIIIIGARATESVQRLRYMANLGEIRDKAYPIYDWTDSDVWLYIQQNGLEFPKAYEYLYRTGTHLNQMRISQFFSVDTAKNLVNMCEFYPNLFDRICKREPNAYMAMLYFDTELYRRKKKRKSKDETDYKAECLKLLNQPERFITKSQKRSFESCRNFIMFHAKILDEKVYKAIYQILVGGDPKNRAFRSLYNIVKWKGEK